MDEPGGTSAASRHVPSAGITPDLHDPHDVDRLPPPARQRVVVQRDPTKSRALRPVRELANDTPLGNAYLGSLLRVQFLLALRMTIALSTFLLVIVGLLVAPTPVRDATLFGVSLGWLVLGLLPYPGFILLSLVFARRAERNELDFVAVLSETQAGSS